MALSVDPPALKACADTAGVMSGSVAHGAAGYTQAYDTFTRGSDLSLLPAPVPNVAELATQFAAALSSFSNRWGSVAKAVALADRYPERGPADEALLLTLLNPGPNAPRPWPFDPTNPNDLPPSEDIPWFDGQPPAGVEPGDYANYTKEHWQQAAYQRAGVDPTAWRPGFEFENPNDQMSRDIWEAYGQYYLLDPKAFAWAGLAKFAGATIYAGWMDIMAAVQHLDGAEKVKGFTDLLRRQYGIPPVPALELAQQLSEFSTDELQQVMRQYMQPMQRAIFEDLAWQHEAYAMGSLPAIEALYRNDEINPEMYRAWQLVEAGDPASLREASKLMVRQEQFVVLQPWYDKLAADPEFGTIFTLMMSAMADSPVPGGRAFRDVVPVPPGNIASAKDRKKWIDEALLPDFDAYVRNNPKEMALLMRPDNLIEMGEARRKLAFLPYRR